MTAEEHGAPQGYGPGPGQPGWAPQQTSTQAVVALALAIGSFVVCPFVAAVAALVVASGAEREIAASGGRVTGLPLVRAARITSWVNIAVSVVGTLLVVLALGLFATSVSTAP